MAFLSVNAVSKTFTTPGGRVVQALSDVTFSIQKGCILSVIGHNGSGKTTLLNCVRNAFPPDSGDIRIAGVPIRRNKHSIVSVYQDVGTGVVASMTAWENLALVQSENQKRFLWSFPRRRYWKATQKFLREANLLARFETFGNTPASELSGGQRQQLAVAMAMMRHPTVLLLDEFVANLDPTVRAEILEWTITWIRKMNVTVLMVTHDHDLAATWGDKVLELVDGQVARVSDTPGGRSE